MGPASDEPQTDDAEAWRILVRNEQLKARATFLNGLAVAAFAVGALAPVATGIISSGTLSLAAGLLAAICAAISFALHSLAMKVLTALET